MAQTDDRHLSPWVDTTERPRLGNTRFRQVTPDVLVVGAGVTGLTTALLLQQEGRTVAVMDAGRLGASVTTHSTVKVTVGHGTVYSKISRMRGTDAARVYAQANVAGFQRLQGLIDDLRIECMLERDQPHVIYAETPEETPALDTEARVAGQIGLPVTRPADTGLPFPVAAALAYPAQAHLHPGRYLAGLGEALVAGGGTLIEEVRATDVRERPGDCVVSTTAGDVVAPHVVIATHYPFLNRGGQFTQLKTRRSYGIAGVLPPGTPAGMTINVGSPTHSTRTVALGGQELLIVVGEGHEVGRVTDTGQRWARLRQWARERFGVEEFRYHWSAEELSTLDGIPFVGAIAPGSSRIMIATGFDGWGMTNGTAAALMLRDGVIGAANAWLATFDARRAETAPPPIAEFVRHNVRVGRRWITDRISGAPEGNPDDLQPGEAAILEVDGEATAAYRDEGGSLHAVSAVCTHMKCTVDWNAGERSWDCPCHGSRFGHDGRVLHGPATQPLERRRPGG